MSSKNNKISKPPMELVNSGEDYFSRLQEIIDTAKEEFHLQIYVFADDEVGKRISAALMRAAARGVKIYLLIDAFGSISFPSNKRIEMEQCGIHFRFFSEFFSLNSLNLGRRLHHKVAVADNKVALIGGINISDNYHHNKYGKDPWLDYAVQLNCGVAAQLQELCRAIYSKKQKLRRAKIGKFAISEDETVTILQNDWLKGDTEISDTYINLLENAKEEVIILGSYFFPGRKIIKALRKCAKNNVKIKLVLSGKSDVTIVKRATSHLYSKLLGYGIELYEWKLSVLHAKIAVVDGKYTTIGSFNLNNLSSYRSIEMNVKIDSVSFAENYAMQLSKVISKSRRINPKYLKDRFPFFTKLIHWSSYIIMRTLEIMVIYSPYIRKTQGSDD